MGYTTAFTGEFTVTPPLSAAEADFLLRYSRTRHCQHQPSPYAAIEPAAPGERLVYGDCSGHGSCISEMRGVPGMWCQWVPGKPAEDGSVSVIKWDGGEKFYGYTEWLEFLIQHFLMPGATALRGTSPAELGSAAVIMSPAGHVLSGVVEWQGEDPDDMGRIIVRDNCVVTQEATRSYGCDLLPESEQRALGG